MNLTRRQALVGGVAAVAASTLTRPALAGPPADLWPRWTAHNPDSSRRIDHGDWADLLDRYLTMGPDSITLFDYGAVTATDRQKLKAYIQRLADTRIADLSRAEQYPLWYNLYNALTVEVILDRYPVDTIRDINLGGGGLFATLFGGGPWSAKLLTIEGEEVSLDDIEHRIMRPIWQDPRIHFGVNCASLGCPNLRRAPFAADTVDADLDAAARAYINHPRGARVTNGRLTASRIFDWYNEDFSGSETAVIGYLRRYADSELAARLNGITAVAAYVYDWGLNDVGRRLS